MYEVICRFLFKTQKIPVPFNLQTVIYEILQITNCYNTHFEFLIHNYTFLNLKQEKKKSLTNIQSVNLIHFCDITRLLEL